MADKSSRKTPQAERIAQALSQITAESNEFLNGNAEEAREKLLASARDLVSATATPVESLLWNIWALPTRTVALRVAVDLKIFETAVEDNGRPKSNEELAATVGASPALVKRIARICASMDMLREEGPSLYVPNEMTRLLSDPKYASGIIHCFDNTQLSFAKMPEYLRNTKFQNPENALDGPFQYANKCGSAFAWLTDRPQNFQAFHQYAQMLPLHRPNWTDMYPVQEHLVQGLKGNGDDDTSVFIDLGGGTGQILQDFRAKVPQYTGRLVLQETPEVVDAAKGMGVGKDFANDSRIQLQVHNFFKPQPIKGARAYFVRFVLHDWPDDQCREILGHLKDAMEPGYSKILINDCVSIFHLVLYWNIWWLVVADEHAAWQHISLDMFMMAQMAAQERTESEWRALIKSCGLKVKDIYNKGQGNEGLIEVVLE